MILDVQLCQLSQYTCVAPCGHGKLAPPTTLRVGLHVACCLSKHSNPENQIKPVLQVKGDVRLINSKVFAADYSMRFPTVVRTRWDKPPTEVQTHEELCQVVQQRVEAGGL